MSKRTSLLRKSGVVLLALAGAKLSGCSVEAGDLPGDELGQASSEYGTSLAMFPTDLTINIVTGSQPIHNNFTRYLTFENHEGDTRSVAVAFTKSSSMHYTGKVTAAGLDELETLVPKNNRSYWDTMSFENHGGTTALDISSMEVWIEYANHAGQWEPDIMIGYAANETLDAGNDSLPLSHYLGRRRYAMDHLGWSLSEFRSKPQAFKQFVFDLGKSGSDGSYPAGNNTKYGLSGTKALLCSETVSWYYYEYDVRVQDQQTGVVYDFRDVVGHGELHDAFKNSGRLYCYHTGVANWVLRDRSYNWVKDSSGNFVTYDQPQAGDYLDRRPTSSAKDDGHAMMMAAWEPRVGSSGGVATIIDAPYPNAFRDVPVHNLEVKGTDYCVGRIPAND